MGEPDYNWEIAIHVNSEAWLDVIFSRKKNDNSDCWHVWRWNMWHPFRIEKLGDDD